MQPFYPDMSGHLMAVTGVTVLHAGIAAWAMAPQPPIALPQQQIIQISMVAPTVIQQKAPQPVKEVADNSKVPPQEAGMHKVEQRPRPLQKTEYKSQSFTQPKQEVRQKTLLTSGIQSREATALKAAITQPVAAAYLKNPPPEYPSRARRHKQQGTVMLEVRVATTGTAQAVAISRSSGHRLLDMAALEAVRQWRFVPARRGNDRVEASVVVPVEFRIN